MALGNVFCPKCGKVGQAKYRRRYHQIYLEVDHYGRKHKDPTKDKFTTHHITYNKTCYIGNLESDTVKTINLRVHQE